MKVVSEINSVIPRGVRQDKKLTEMSESELQAEHSALVQMKSVAESVSDMSIADRVTAMRNIGIEQGNTTVERLAGDPEKIDNAIKQVHRARALLVDHPAAQIETVIHKPTPTKETAEAARERLRTTAEQLDRVGQDLVEEGDDDAADEFFAASQGIRNALPAVNNPDHASVIFDSYKDTAVKALKHIHDRTQQARERREGGGILG
jgi:hypothetical protein